MTDDEVIIFFNFGAVVFWAFTAENEKKYLTTFETYFKLQNNFIHKVDYLEFDLEDRETFSVNLLY